MLFSILFALACGEVEAPAPIAPSEHHALPAGVTLSEAYGLALDETDPVRRHMALAAVYPLITADNVEDMAQVMLSSPARMTPAELRILGRIWGRLNRDTALMETLKWEIPLARTAASSQILLEWVDTQNSQAVVDTFEKLKADAVYPPGVIEEAEIGLVDALGRHGDDDLVLERLVASEPESAHRSRLVATALRAVNFGRPGAFRVLAERVLADDSVDSQLQWEIALVALRFVHLTGEERATEWYEAQLADGPFAEDGLNVIAEKWAREDPVATLDYLGTRPESESPGLARRTTALLWLQSRSADAFPYLRKAVDEDPKMESVIFPVVQYLIANDIYEAMDLAQRLTDAKEKEIVLKQGLVRMTRVDRPAADRYLEEHDVPESVLTAVRLARRMKHVKSEISEAEPSAEEAITR